MTLRMILYLVYIVPFIEALLRLVYFFLVLGLGKHLYVILRASGSKR